MDGGEFLSLIGKDKEGVGGISKIDFSCCNDTRKCYRLTAVCFQMICLLPP